MKRKIALLLALVMVLSMVPMMSFAASENRVNKVPTVADDHEFNVAADAPTLRIQEKDGDWGTTKQTFRLQLENAEWLDSIESLTVSNVVYDKVSSLKIEKLDDVTVEVEVTPQAGDKSRVEIPLLTEMTAKGEATVTVIPRDSAVSGGTYTFAKTTDGKAVATVRDSVTFGSGTKEIKTIEIDETNIGAFDGRKTVRLRLPADFEWVVTDSSAAAFEEAHVNFRGDYNGNATVVKVDADEDVLEITFNLNKTTNVRGSIFLEGLAIKANSDARFGDVVVAVSKDVDSAELLVAKYVDYGVTVEAAGDPKELVAGKFTTHATEDEHKLQKLVIKENIEGSWIERVTSIEFPSWVKVRDVKVNKVENLTNLTTSSTISAFSVNKNKNVVEFTPAIVSGKKAKLELTFYVSVEADATGDITATVSSRGLDEDYEVVLGKAVAPVIVETNPTDVKVGVQNQELGKITLTEIAAGSFIKGESVKIALEDDFRWKEEPTVKVVQGDLRIDRIKTNKESLTFEITRESSKPSVIEITGAKVDLYRHLPEGEFKVYVGGKAIVQNFEDYVLAGQEDFAFKTEWAAEPVVAKIITPAPNARPAVSLTIGVVPEGGDVAPYVKNNRTFAPVSAVAQALGVAKGNIIWNEEARTVTILGDKTVQMTIGSTTLLVNGTPVVMDVAPEITNSRTFLPIAWLAKALDVNYTWDAATQTVTFY